MSRNPLAAHQPKEYFPRRAIRNEQYKLIHNLLPGRTNPIKGVDACNAWETVHGDKYNGTVIRAVYDRYSNPPEYELYDLREDPDEFNNLTGQSDRQPVLDDLKAKLLDWRTRTADPLLSTRVLTELTEKHKQLALSGEKWSGPTP